MTHPFSEYSTFDAVGLADLVARRVAHPAELLEAALVQMEDTWGLNAIVASDPDGARRAAQKGLPDGPFHGVPYLFKDLIVEEGQPTTFGSVFFRDYVADTTAAYITRTLNAGFNVFGRTNTPELGLLPTTEPTLHGVTFNPWDPHVSVGGSSGGAAAAVAAGIVPMAQGGDGGGSIRIPASNTGLFGFKPSRGRNPQAPGSGAEFLGVDHAITRSVRDSATLLDVTAGPVPGDMFWAPPHTGRYTQDVVTDPGKLRIAYSVTDFRGEKAHPHCVAAVESTVGLLEELGHHVVEASPPIDGHEFSEAFLVIWATIPAGVLKLIAEGAKEKLAGRMIVGALGEKRGVDLIRRLDTRKAGMDVFETFTRGLIKRAYKMDPGHAWMARSSLSAISYEFAGFMADHDLFLTPVLGSPPVPVGRFPGTKDIKEIENELSAYVAYTPLANVTGCPAMSVPLHWSPDNLPIGSHFTAHYGDETTLFRLAGQLERARPWVDRRPPV